MSQTWISKGEYDESGPAIVHRKLGLTHNLFNIQNINEDTIICVNIKRKREIKVLSFFLELILEIDQTDMGACASVPKEMRGKASAAPPPEPAKEESVQAEQHTTEEVIKVEKEENKADEVDETKQQSLGSLLVEPEKTEGKKEPNETQQPQVEAPAEPKKEESKEEPEARNEEVKVEPKKEEPKTEAPAVPKVIEEQKEKKTEAKETQKRQRLGVF
ncbi:cilia- and flagella-associated protein 251-like [Durio zibethinus]|uniref:Cilia- and flagella-associated protein 251-like n=1 Tax=Durio zibethinus TaxID=66656 RepID=A0A6P5X9K7_DURZI|nr:cilia- and flagella-associated protein 251-like [Durio zibethinus]